MHKPHAERPKMPGLPRHRSEGRVRGNATSPGGAPLTVPIVPVVKTKPARTPEPPPARSSLRAGWSRGIVDQMWEGEAVQRPAAPLAERPVRSQASLRARAGMPVEPFVQEPVAEPPARLYAPAPEVEVLDLPAPVQPSVLDRVRQGVASLFRLFSAS